MITINRAIDGISLNGNEVLRDEFDNVLAFADEEDAKQYLMFYGFTEDEIEKNIIFEEE